MVIDDDALRREQLISNYSCPTKCCSCEQKVGSNETGMMMIIMMMIVILMMMIVMMVIMVVSMMMMMIMTV